MADTKSSDAAICTAGITGSTVYTIESATSPILSKVACILLIKPDIMPDMKRS